MSNYSESELKQIYSLGYSFLINANYKLAETIFAGLISVQADYLNAYLGLATAKFLLKDYEGSSECCKKVVELDRFCLEGLLIYVANSIKLGDQQRAGTYLGEIKDLLKDKPAASPEIYKYEKLLNLQYDN